MRSQGSRRLPERGFRRVVLVGNKISPGNPVTKPDGTLVRTLWGEMAWQLGHARGIFSRKPMVRLAQQVVAHLPPRDQPERLGVGPQPQDFQDVHLPGHIDVLRHSFKPPRALLGAKYALHLIPQPLFHGAHRFLHAIVKLERTHMFVEITRLFDPTA